MTSPDLRAVASAIQKSRDAQVIELNRDLKPEAVARMIKSVTDHAARAAKTKRVIVVSFVSS
jgi:hypothetical protein